MNYKTEEKFIAESILAQLGGAQFCMMIGAKKPLLMLDRNNERLGGLTVGFRARAKDGIKSIRVELMMDDTYRVSFYGMAPHFACKFTKSNVYCDELQSLFEEITGLCAYLVSPVRFG